MTLTPHSPRIQSMCGSLKLCNLTHVLAHVTLETIVSFYLQLSKDEVQLKGTKGEKPHSWNQ